MRTVGGTRRYCECCGFDVPDDVDEIVCPARDGDFCEPVRRGLRARPHRARIARQYPVTKDKSARAGGKPSLSVSMRCRCGHRGVDHPRDEDLRKPRRCRVQHCGCKRFVSRKVKAIVEIVAGPGRLLAVYINGTRIAGEKPWGGGRTLARWNLFEADVSDLRAALRGRTT